MKKQQPKNSTRKSKSKKSGLITPGKIVRYSLVLLFISFIVATAYNYRHGVLYYLGFKTNKRIESLTKEEKKLSDLRMYEILSRHRDKVFGFDVSEYQGKIDWQKVSASDNDFPMKFVFIRATAGKDKTDSRFVANWKGAHNEGLVCGAYHYYRPNENSVKQADNFIKTVKLKKGDLPPVLDIEKIPSRQSLDSLRLGLQRWLNKVEKHYGIKPIIYSGESFYADFLKKEFKGYNLWIANYSFFEEEIRKEWLFWQFTDKASLEGIEGNVDVNIYNGNLSGINVLRK